MDDEFEDWFDSAVDKELFELTAPSAQYHAAKASWVASGQSTNDRIDAIEKEIKLIKSSMNSILKAIKRLSYSDSLHHGVYR